MKTDSVEVTLQSSLWGSDENKYKGEHTFRLVAGDKELILTTPDGQEIARITVQTLTKDIRDEEGDYHTKPSKNFTVCFEAVENGGSKNTANAWVENLPVEAE